jgi:hypothetical protein
MFKSNNEGHRFSFDQILYVHICESLGFWRYLRDTHGAQKLLVWQADSLEFGPFNNSWLKSVAHWLGAGLFSPALSSIDPRRSRSVYHAIL